VTVLRVGFVGCGLIARHHAANLVDDPRARIVAVTDLDGDRAGRFADDFGHGGRSGAVRPDADAVVADVDALYVCTWTSAHPALVTAAARAGVAVFCEKPLATSLAGAAAMTDAVEGAGVTNQVGLVLRRSPAFRVLRHRVRAAESGPIMNLVFRDDQYLPIQGLYGSTWRADADRAGGGTLLEHSIHDLDLIDWLLGPVVEVSARTGSVHGLDGIDDQATVLLMGEGGAQACLVSVWHDVLTRPSQRRVEVFTRGGYFSLEGDWAGPVDWDRSRRVDGGPAGAVGRLGGPELVAEAHRIDGLGTNPDQAFVDAVLAGRAAYPTFAQALRAHRLVDAAYRSAAAGGAVVGVD
jgi:predicted dehydrogenase